MGRAGFSGSVPVLEFRPVLIGAPSQASYVHWKATNKAQARQPRIYDIAVKWPTGRNLRSEQGYSTARSFKQVQ